MFGKVDLLLVSSVGSSLRELMSHCGAKSDSLAQRLFVFATEFLEPHHQLFWANGTARSVGVTVFFCRTSVHFHQLGQWALTRLG